MNTDLQLAATVRQFGRAADVVTLEPCLPVTPGPGEVCVRMVKAALNPSDFVTISGAYRSRTTLPFVAGFEGVGIIEAVGDGVCLPIGTRVLPIGDMGAWQHWKTTRAEWCFTVDDRLSDAQAATLYINPMTAWRMIHHQAHIQRGQVVALSAAASAIGRIMIRMLNHIGVAPYAVIRNDSSRTLLDGLQLSGIVTSHHTLPPLDVVFDAVGGDTGTGLLDRLTPTGHMIHYGLLSGQPLTQAFNNLGQKRFELFALRNWVHTVNKTEIADGFTHMTRLMLDGTASSPIEATYPLSEIHAAISHAHRAGRVGKILLDL